MLRRLMDRLGQSASILKRLVRSTSTDTEPTSRIAPSQGISNEARVIADVRANIPQLKALALQKQLNYLSQWDAYIADINAPAEPGRFTDLEEDNKRLAEEYDEILAEIFEQMRLYDRYCEYHQLDYSSAWRALLADLDGYLSGLPSAASRHAAEALAVANQNKSTE